MAPSGSSAISGSMIGVLVVVGALIIFRLMRSSRPQALKLKGLWIRPSVFAAIALAVLAATPPAPTLSGVAILALALAVGGALGWQRGKFTRITVDPATGGLTAQASPAGVMILVAIVLLRVGLRGFMLQGQTGVGLSPNTLADGLILLFAGMIIVQNVEMGLRARALLTARPA